MTVSFCWITISFLMVDGSSAAPAITADSSESLSVAIRSAGPGTVIRLAPGSYSGGLYLSGKEGSDGDPIVIEAADSDHPPVFTAAKGGKLAIHLSGCSHVRFSGLRIVGFPLNGINIDDGGNPSRPATGITLENIVIEDIGPRGNHDGLKLSGLSDFVVRNCRFAGWGGSAIDMVGCHEGEIDNCQFTGKDEFSQQNGVQMKGGSSKIRVTRSWFERAGERAINLGGSTGAPYFRPKDAAWEAETIEVAGNQFIGSLSPVAWVGIDGGHVHHNTIYLPEKWVGRILQENTDSLFGQCRNGRFEHNIVVYDQRVRTLINVGGNTEPQSFAFRGNAWFDLDSPNRGPSSLPVAETDGIFGVDPQIEIEAKTNLLKVRSKDPRLQGIGAGAFRQSGKPN